jgi:hypothetical protein
MEGRKEGRNKEKEEEGEMDAGPPLGPISHLSTRKDGF